MQERYEKVVALWQSWNITTDAQLAQALNGHSIAFAYHSGKIENERITYATQGRQTNCSSGPSRSAVR